MSGWEASSSTTTGGLRDDGPSLGTLREAKLKVRGEESKPPVAAFFDWIERELVEAALLPTNPFTQAALYALKRKQALEVFLANPDMPPDTNHLERALRVVPMGGKSWVFCWTEVGAEQVGQIQSLLTTCVLHGVDPYTYLVDVLQRIDTHPNSRLTELTPRLWKKTSGTCRCDRRSIASRSRETNRRPCNDVRHWPLTLIASNLGLYSLTSSIAHSWFERFDRSRKSSRLGSSDIGPVEAPGAATTLRPVHSAVELGTPTTSELFARAGAPRIPFATLRRDRQRLEGLDVDATTLGRVRDLAFPEVVGADVHLADWVAVVFGLASEVAPLTGGHSDPLGRPVFQL